uniref:Uncharacterized protein n=1 Tax=Arundo donax TaxID=35708 RepID=A0A0A8YGF4_ARUDO
MIVMYALLKKCSEK